MTLRTRTLWMITLLLIIAVGITSAGLAWNTRQLLLEQTRQNGLTIAQLLARSARFAEQVPQDVEASIGDQMIVEATIAAHMVAIAEQDAGLSAEQINAHLKQITDRTVLEEFWITDQNGHAYLTSDPSIDFTFSPDPAIQPQASMFWPLINGEKDNVVQEAMRREVDNRVFKYAGVPGIDHPRIVQVGYPLSFLDKLRQQIGITRLVNELVGSNNVKAIYILDEQRHLAFARQTSLAASVLTPADEQHAQSVFKSKLAESYLEDDQLRVIAPIQGTDGKVKGAILIALSTEQLNKAIRSEIQLSVGVAVIILLSGLIVSRNLVRRVTQPVANLTQAAASIEAGVFNPDDLEDVARRKDELGQLARVFIRMARQVEQREQELKQQVHALQIEIDEKRRQTQVNEIVESDFFRHLQSRAAEIRKRQKHQP